MDHAKDHIAEQECPLCGAPLRFSPEDGKLVCDWCGQSFDIDVVGAQSGGYADTDYDREKEKKESESFPVYNCLSCGAEVLANPENVALICPYCGNNIVLTDKVAGGLMPNGVIPFKTTPKDLPKKVNEFYKGRKLLPKKFFSASSIGEVQGVYVPFWLYDADAQTEASFNGEITSVTHSGNYKITHHKHFLLDRSAAVSYANVPVDASVKMDDALMDSLEPYDFSELVPFDKRYLSGFVADRFDVPSGDARPRAVERMKTSSAQLINARSVSGYENVSVSKVQTELSNEKVSYVLLPVYCFDVDYEGQKYSYAMNGQTGKVLGVLPEFKKEKRKLFWSVCAGVSAALFALLSLLFST